MAKVRLRSSVVRIVVLALLASTLAVAAATDPAAADPPPFLAAWGTQGSANGQFNHPVGVVADGAGNVYVADSGNHRIQKFSSSGAFIAQWGSEGTGNGQFDHPGGLAVDGAGNVYVADRGNHRIQKFSSSGAFIAKWGTEGSGNGQFSYPSDVAVDSTGNVYVSDQLNDRVQKFTSTGSFITKWGSRGTGNGEFDSPTGVAVDAGGHVYVADSGIGGDGDNGLGNHRIQKFTSTGAFIRKWGGRGSGNGQFEFPSDVTVDASGNVYVSDNANDRVQKFTSTGAFVSTWGTFGSGNGQFDFPSGVAVDAHGDIYVSDFYNHRIQKFAGGGTGPPPVSQLDWVAMGDSYAAGVGIGLVRPGCDTDRLAYGPRAADDILSPDYTIDVRHVACSGATTEDVLVNQVPMLDSSDNVVTLTSGGNDIGFADKVAGCFWGNCGPDTFSLLADEPGGAQTWDDVFDRLTSLYAQVRDRMAPDGHLYVVGYPMPFARQRDQRCQTLNPIEQNAANALVTRLDDTIYLAVQDANRRLPDLFGIDGNVHFVDWRESALEPRGYTIPAGYADSGQRFDTFRSRDGLCNAESRTPTVQGFFPGARLVLTKNSLHPNTTGYWRAATEVATAIRHYQPCCGATPDESFQPDLRTTLDGAPVGEDVYDATGAGQTADKSTTAGRAVTYRVTVENDGAQSTKFHLVGGRSTARYTVEYRSGGRDITSQIIAGSYTTPALAPGGTDRVDVRITPGASAPSGSELTRLLTATATVGVTVADSIQLVTRRT